MVVCAGFTLCFWFNNRWAGRLYIYFFYESQKKIIRVAEKVLNLEAMCMCTNDVPGE